jgi:hypothetical protein
MTEKPKPKNILVQEELLQGNEYHTYLVSSKMKIIVSVRQQPTYDLLKSLDNRFKTFSNFCQFHFSVSGNYPPRYDIYLFASQNYEEAKRFAINNPDVKVIVIVSIVDVIEFETQDNFYVRTWQWFCDYMKQLYPKPEKKK